MRREEIEKSFHDLKHSFELGVISEDEFRAKIDDFLLQDDGGAYWTIGARTEEWFRHDAAGWVQASPPPTLKPVRPEAMKEEPPLAASPREHRRRIGLALISLLFLFCLIVVGLVSYQLGRRGAVTGSVQRSPTIAIEVTQAPTVEATRTSVVMATPSQTEAPGMVTPSPTSTQEKATATSTPSPAPLVTATTTPMPVAGMKYGAPVLLEPEDGADFGPRYHAILMWEPPGRLREEEYYHVEICWDGCDGVGEFWGAYVSGTEYLAPGLLREAAIDDRYYWHVTVRVQTGDTPAGPTDPAISPPSETWVFVLSRE